MSSSRKRSGTLPFLLVAEKGIGHPRRHEAPNILQRRIVRAALRFPSRQVRLDLFELLEKLLSNPQWDGASARYDLKKPFAILAEMRGDGEWRGRVEEFRTAVRECQASTQYTR